MVVETTLHQSMCLISISHHHRQKLVKNVNNANNANGNYVNGNYVFDFNIMFNSSHQSISIKASVFTHRSKLRSMQVKILVDNLEQNKGFYFSFSFLSTPVKYLVYNTTVSPT